MKRMLPKSLLPFFLALIATSASAALVEEFPLNEGATNSSATTVYSTASTNTGSFINGPTWQTANLPPIPGGTGACAYFGAASGITPYIQTTSTAVTGNTPRTIAFWMMAPTGTQPQNAGLVSWGVNSAGQRFTLRMDPGTSGGVQYALRFEDQGAFATARTPLNDGKWHHLAVVFPGAVGPNGCTFYVDGINDGQSAGSSNTLNTTVTTGTIKTYFAIGNAPDAGSAITNQYGVKAAFADVRVYNTALTQSDIMQLVYGAGTAPSIIQNPSNQSAVLGDTNATVTFSVGASGSGVNYIWRRNGTTLGAPNLSTLTVGPGLTDANLGSYDVIVSNNWGSTNSAAAVLQWGTPAVDPPHQAGITGGNVSFEIPGLPAYQNYKYQWLEAGAPIPGATNSTFTKTSLGAGDNTNYSVVLTLGPDSATSAPVAVTVVSTSGYAAQVLGDNPMAYWRLDESSGATVAADQSGFDNGEYLNYDGSELGSAGALTGDSDSCSSFNLDSEHNYVEVPYDAALARTNKFTLEAWVKPNSAGPGVYQTIIGSHTKTAVSGAELGINGQSWDFRTGSSTVSSATILDDLNGGTVTNGVWTHVVGTFDGSVKRLYVDGELVGSETTNVFASTTLWRIGADDTFQASAGQYLSGWIDEPAIYWRALTQAQVINHYDMAFYGAGQAPSIVGQPQNQTILFGSTNSSVTFSVLAGGTPPFAYQWSLNGTNISSATGQSLTITNVGPSDLGSYTVTVNNGISSVQSAPASLSYSPLLISPADQTAMPGTTVTFTALTAQGGNYTYQWTHNSGNLSGATSQTLALPSVSTNDAGTYQVLVTSGAASELSEQATLEVLVPQPNPNYSQTITNDAPADWWRMDDPAGSTLVTDSIGGNPGSVYPDVTLGAEGAVLGDADTAASFTGYGQGSRAGNSRIQISNTPQVNAGIFSVEVWALANGGAGTARSVLTSRDTNGPSGYCVYAGSDDHWQFWLGTGASTWTIIEGPPITLNQWTHLVGIYDGTNGIFYVDAALAGQTNTAYQVNGIYYLNVGCGESESITGGDFFPGRIDELAIYDSALTRAQVQAHYIAAFPSAATPRFTVQPLTRAALAGGTYQFSVTGYGTPPFAYSWLKNGVTIPNQTDATLNLSGLSSADNGTYNAVLTSGSNTNISSPATLTVLKGEAVSVNLQGNEPNYTVAADGGYAGFVRTPNWNDVGYHPNSGSASNLVNNLGAPTTVNISWATRNNQRWDGPIRVPQGDYAMLSGFFDDNAGTNGATVTISGIPANYQSAGYSLYVYMGGPAASTTGLAPGGEVSSTTYYGAVSVGAQTNFYHAIDLASWDGNFVQATNTDPLDASPTNADYAVFTNLNGSSATIVLGEDTGSGNIGPCTISGVQLVANIVNQPTLTIQQSGANISLSWSGSWVLQHSYDLNCPSCWQDVSNATSPYTVTTTSRSQEFFRLRSP